jgi:two-component system response regulator AtoC
MATILIAEDDQPVRYVLAQMLGQRYQVVEAANVIEGIAAAQFHRPDLILLDLNLEGHHDGLEVIRTLRSEPDPALAQVPMVVLTGYLDEAAWVTARAAGANSCVSKPVDLCSFLPLIDLLLAKRDG